MIVNVNVENLSFTELEEFIGDEFTDLKIELKNNSIDKKYFWSMVQQLFDERFEEELG